MCKGGKKPCYTTSGSNTIIYIEPRANYLTSFLTGDEGYNKANPVSSYTPPANGIPALLDPTNPHKLLNNNAFGHKWRRTGINGGYYDMDTAEFKLVDGTVSTEAVVFGTAAGSDFYLIDHHTNRGWKPNIQGSTTWALHQAAVVTLNGAGWAGFTDYYLPDKAEAESITFYEGAFITVVIPFTSNNSIKTSTPYNGLETTQHFYRNGWNFTNRSDATNDGAYFCRRHYTD